MNSNAVLLARFFRFLNEYVDFLDSVECGNVTSEQKDSHFYQLVQTFQIHCHSKTCRQYENTKCGFKFGRFFTDKTIIAIQLQNTLSQVEKFKIFINIK